MIPVNEIFAGIFFDLTKKPAKLKLKIKFRVSIKRSLEMQFLSRHFIKFIAILYVVFISIGAIACNQAGKTNYTQADFEKLRWLEGSWRGADTNGHNPFYERYRLVGDAKIETDSFSDSTLSKVDRQSTTYLEEGSIYHRSNDTLWTVTKFDDSTIEFSPKEKAANSFTWKKESADRWTARITTQNAHGGVTETLYRMERIK